jgi:Domain of unknown function (DUF3387)
MELPQNDDRRITVGTLPRWVRTISEQGQAFIGDAEVDLYKHFEERELAGVVLFSASSEQDAMLLEKFEIVKAMYHGFDYARGLVATPHERLVVLAKAVEWILGKQHEAAARETSEDGKRR